MRSWREPVVEIGIAAKRDDIADSQFNPVELRAAGVV
jgi:hypothetical protein